MANPISNFERSLLLIFTFLGFLFFATAIIEPAIREYNYSVYVEQNRLIHEANNEKGPSFSISVSGWTVPGFHLISFFILISIIRTKKYIVSFSLTTIYLLFFVYGIYLRNEFFFLSSLIDGIYKTSQSLRHFDYIGVFFISTLLFWQFSILLRSLKKTSFK